MKKLLWIVTGILLLCIGTTCSRHSSVTLENDYFRYVIGPDGKNLHFIDKKTNTDYCKTDTASFCAQFKFLDCAQVQCGDTLINASAVSYGKGRLKVTFGESGVVAVIKTTAHSNHIEMEVESVNGGDVKSLSFINIPLTLKGKPGEPFAACSFALNTFTHVNQLPALQTHLWACCYPQFGMNGAKAALIGVPGTEILPVIRDIVSSARELPHVKVAGAWAQDTPFCHGSYLFNFGALTEENVGEWIDMAKSLGFNQIDNHGGGSHFFRFGDFHLNEEKWPQGWDNFRNIVARLHGEGIGSIFHTYAFFIDKQSKYVTPVPHLQLDAFRSFTLAEPLSDKAADIRVVESTADVSTITGFFERNSVTLHIGDELITFAGVTKELPYTFTGCIRGAYGTKAASHPARVKARHLKECFGLFVPDCESPLFEEIAAAHAEIVDYCDFDGFYLDAIDGSDILRGGENAWYWGQRFTFLIYKHLKKPVGMEMSSMWHQMWNFRSRWQAWDYPNRGHKRFIDIHADAVNSGLLLPMHLGWWNFQHFSPPQVEPSYPDVIEYLGCKLIGYNAGLSLTGAVNRDNLRNIPLFSRLVSLLKTYEDLRHTDYFGESIKAQLREPGKEFTLFRDDGGAWRFRPAQYVKHRVTGLDDGSGSWQTVNSFGSQPVKLRIEALMSAGPYNASGNVVLTDFMDITTVMKQSAAEGVTFGLAAASDTVKAGTASGRFTARNAGTVPQNAAWTQAYKGFDPCLDLGKHQALGVWINGDGQGELLNFRLESPRHLAYGAVADRYVTVDFTGWRYCELVETESERWSDYTWNDGKWLYNVYREVIHFDAVESMSFWYNNLPPGREATCYLSPVKALPMVSATIKNPSVTVNGKTVVFPVTMQSGDFLEFNSSSDCTHYGPKGELRGKVTPKGEAPLLLNGANGLSFSCTATGRLTPRVGVTVIGYGEPLE